MQFKACKGGCLASLSCAYLATSCDTTCVTSFDTTCITSCGTCGCGTCITAGSQCIARGFFLQHGQQRRHHVSA